MGPSSKDYAEANPPPIDGIFRGIANAFNSVRRVLSDSLQLFSLEVRRAGLTLVWMVILGTIAAMLIVTAWLALMGALAWWAVSLGLTWIGAIAGVALINMAAAAIAIFSCLAISRDLLFPATRRQLDASPARPDAT